MLRAADRPVTLVPTGPLTNVALLLRAFPALRDRIGAISLMGGSLGVGNTTASAEFNVWQDPEAAAIVFGSGLPILMAGLDVTHQALVLPDDVARLEALGTRTGRVVADLMRFFGLPPGALRLGRPADPRRGRRRRARRAVADRAADDADRRRAWRRAGARRTIGDERGVSGKAPNAEVLVRLDRPAFIDLLVEAIATFP